MTTATAQAQTAAIKAAMGVARELAEGQLSPAALDAVALEECRQLFARVAGPGDALWELHVEVARQVLAVGGGIPAGELAEWLAVTRSAEGGDAPRGPSWIETLLEQLADEDQAVAEL